MKKRPRPHCSSRSSLWRRGGLRHTTGGLLHKVGVYAYQGWAFGDNYPFRYPWDNATIESCPVGPVLTAQEDLLSPSPLCAHLRPRKCLRPRRGPGDFDIGLISRRTSFY